MRMLETVAELIVFLRERKKYFLAPILIVLILMALLVVLAEIPALTPFIYAIF